MRSARGRRCAAALALVAVILTVASEAGALTAVSTVPSQMSAAAYVQEWAQVLWGLVTRQSGMALSPVGDPITNPDGSLTQNMSAPDGTTAVVTRFSDGSRRLVVTLPDGTVQVFFNSALATEGDLFVIYSTLDSSDGLFVEYATTFDLSGTPIDPYDDIQETRGSAVLPGGTTQTFSAVTAGGRTDIESAQSDGSVFALSVPTAGLSFLPNFAQDATGTYTDQSFVVSFTLTSTPANPSRWAAFLCDVGGGTTGVFGLNSDFSGFGQVEQTTLWGSQVVALVSWTRGGDVEAYSLTGENIHMTPSAAALDFLRHRWETLTASLAPAPGASAVNLPHPRASRPGLRGTRPGAVRPLLSARDRRDVRRRRRR